MLVIFLPRGLPNSQRPHEKGHKVLHNSYSQLLHAGDIVRENLARSTTVNISTGSSQARRREFTTSCMHVLSMPQLTRQLPRSTSTSMLMSCASFRSRMPKAIPGDSFPEIGRHWVETFLKKHACSSQAPTTCLPTSFVVRRTKARRQNVSKAVVDTSAGAP